MLTGIKAVIFDLDGTLVDSMWMWKTIDIEYLGRFGIGLPDDLQDCICGMSFSETANYFKERFHLPDSIDQIKNDWNAMANDKYTHDVKPKEGVIRFLELLKEKGIKAGIATSNSKELVTIVMKSLGMDQYFDAIHTSCEVAKGKPAPDIYLYVAEKLNVSPENCLVFEDIPQGILAGKNAGMKVCAIEDEYSSHLKKEKELLADYFINSFNEI